MTMTDPAPSNAAWNAPFPLAAVLSLMLGFLVVVGLTLLLGHDPTRLLSSASFPLAVYDPVKALPREPGADELRIFVIGASETQGFPYEPALSASFATLLGAGLQAVLPQRRVVVRPIASTALESTQFVEILREVLPWQPHIVCVTLGNNEYSNRIVAGMELVPSNWLDRSADLQSRARWLFEFPIDKDPVRAARLERAALDHLGERAFQSAPGRPAFAKLPVTAADRELLAARMHRNMIEIADLAKAAGARCVFLHSAYHLTGTWPFGMTERDAAIDTLVLRHRRAGDVNLAEVETELRRQPERAELHLLRAQLLVAASGRDTEARLAFMRGRDLDPAPMHGTAETDGAFAAFAQARPDTLCLEVEQALLDERGLPAAERFLDYAHVDEQGHRQIARFLAEQCAQAGILPPLPSDWIDRFEAATRQALQQVDQQSRLRARMRTAWSEGVLHMLCGNHRDALASLATAYAELAQPELTDYGLAQVPHSAPLLLYCLFSLIDAVDANRAPARQLELKRRLDGFIRSHQPPDALIDEVLSPRFGR